MPCCMFFANPEEQNFEFYLKGPCDHQRSTLNSVYPTNETRNSTLLSVLAALFLVKVDKCGLHLRLPEDSEWRAAPCHLCWCDPHQLSSWLERLQNRYCCHQQLTASSLFIQSNITPCILSLHEPIIWDAIYHLLLNKKNSLAELHFCWKWGTILSKLSQGNRRKGCRLSSDERKDGRYKELGGNRERDALCAIWPPWSFCILMIKLSVTPYYNTSCTIEYA